MSSIVKRLTNQLWAKDRVAKATGRSPKEFKYSKNTNRATLKD